MQKKIWEIELMADFIRHEFVFQGELTDAILKIEKTYRNVQSLHIKFIQAL